MDWVEILRLLAVVGLAYGAWQGFRNMPRPVRHNGRRYYRQPDGRFATIWGRRVKDPGLAAELERLSSSESVPAHTGRMES